MTHIRKVVDIGLSVYLFAMVMCIILLFSGVLRASDPLPPPVKDVLPPPVKDAISAFPPEVRTAPKGWHWEYLQDKWWLVKDEPLMIVTPEVVTPHPFVQPVDITMIPIIPATTVDVLQRSSVAPVQPVTRMPIRILGVRGSLITNCST